VKHNHRPALEGLSPAQLDLLGTYEALLQDRGIALGVVAEGDRVRLWQRHIADSLRGVPCLPPGTRSVADLGSGGGLPGIPVAIARPALLVDLVEKTSRRAAFLELAVETLGLRNARVVASAVKDAQLDVDGCLTRAVASPKRAWELASRLLGEDGFLMYWAGRSWDQAAVAQLSAIGVDPQVCVPPSEAGQGSVIMMTRKVTHPERGSP
jgi:16S rRNA (guanine527-N7)-methyltransferase